MSYCPIHEAAKVSPRNVAIYSDTGRCTYAELDNMIDRNHSVQEVFFANQSIASIVHFFSLLRQDRVAAPISIREPNLPEIDMDQISGDVSTLFCTSGTMGRPKMAMHSLSNHLFSATHPHPDLSLEECDCYLLSLPLNHVGGTAILFRAFCARASVIIGEIHKRFATHVSFVPTQLKRFLSSGNQLYFHRLKAILLGGASIPLNLCNWAADRHLPLYLTYGMTETATQLATSKYDPKLGVHFGKPLEGRRYKVDQNQDVWASGKTLFSGYLNSQVEIRDGWYRTGDLGRTGRYGLEILGRRDRMIISGGENIYLDELEGLFLQIPHVINVTVKERNCEEFGKRPVAYLNARKPLEISQIRSRLQSLIPRYKVPNEDDIHIQFAQCASK